MILRIFIIAALAIAFGGVSQAEAQQSKPGYSTKQKRYTSRSVRRPVRPVRRFNRAERVGTPEYNDFETPYVYIYGPPSNGPYPGTQTLYDRVTIGSPDYPVR